MTSGTSEPPSPPAAASPLREAWKCELAQVVPNLAKLTVRAARDPRVPAKSKAVAAAAVVLAVSPVDLIPDFVPVLGKVDDILLVAFALNRLVEQAGIAVVREHWDGDPRILSALLEALNLVAGMIPRRLRLLLNRYL